MLDVLLADDDENVRLSVADALVGAGCHVTEARDGAEAADLIASHVYDVAVCDLRMPHVDGLTLLRRIRREAPGTAVVLMTSYPRAADVVDCLDDGAVDYVLKPFDPEQFARCLIAPLAARRSLQQGLDAAQVTPARAEPVIVALSPAMRGVSERIGQLAGTDLPVLVTGDGGTGKHLVARAIHAQASRRRGPFVLLDAGALSEVMSASEWGDLSAEEDVRDAWFREAEGGTLVVDAVEKLSRPAQAHLLRVLKVPAAPAHGTAESEPRGVRLVALTRENLADRVVAGEFLEALYYRLDGGQIHLPALKDRGEDLRPLVTALLAELGATTPASPAALLALEGYSFPGNVRELRSILEQALARADGGPLDVGHLPEAVVTRPSP